MYLLFDKALAVRSSNSILFFKKDEEHGGLWKIYHKIPDVRGNLYFIKGNIRIQITTDELIYFYIIDKETMIPTLENCMFNFKQCSQMMFGPKVRFSIIYKTNEKGIQIFTRKFYHNFKVNINGDNFEGAAGCNLGKMNAYVMAENQHIGIYNNSSFELI
jgi:hypothetical protein